MQQETTQQTLKLIKAQQPDASLRATAERLWPDGEPSAEYNRAEWIRAVGVVRGTRSGWVRDVSPLPPVPARFQQ